MPRHTQRFWTTEEIERLRVLFMEERVSQRKIAKMIGRTEGSVSGQLKRCGFLQGRYSGWSDEDIKKLRELWCERGASGSQIGALLGRSRSAVLGKLHRMRLTSGRPNKKNGYIKRVCVGNSVLKPKKVAYWNGYRLHHLKKYIDEGKNSFEISELFEGKISAAGIRAAASKYFDGMGGASRRSNAQIHRPEKEHPEEMRRVTLHDLGKTDCRYPLWGPERRGGHYCGNPTEGGPYCTHHTPVAYIPGTATRKRNWEKQIDTAEKKYQ